MKNIFFNCFRILVFVLFTKSINAEIFIANSQQSFQQAHDLAEMNDSIIWESGSYSDIYMNITKDHLFIAATELGATIFTGKSRVKITSDYITLQGFQFVGGDIGTNDVINTAGSYNHFNQLNIRAYISYKYLVIREECQYVKVTYCNFENRLNLDDKNILSILVDEINPGYHKIQYCSFKNFDGTGNDLGIEPIRIGLSTQADRISRSLVEYCYFTQCNGDGEIISSKARQNVYRFNTFEDNPKAELVLRHGSEVIVYGNFFLNGKGGIRVREGQDHYIYNNYFYNLDDRAIYLQNEDSDPLDNINICFNTIGNCAEIILGGNGSNKPTNVTFANNIFTEPIGDLFEDPTGTEHWISNIAHGDLGMGLPQNGMTIIDPQLVKNSYGFYGLDDNSPAINASLPGYADIPQFDGMDEIDIDVMYDLMGQERPASIEEKDLGCSEYPHYTLIRPISTEENTGPDYNSSIINSIKKNGQSYNDVFHIYPNPISDRINFSLYLQTPSIIQIKVLDLEGRPIRTIFNELLSTGQNSISFELEDLPSSVYTIQMIIRDIHTGSTRSQSRMLMKQ